MKAKLLALFLLAGSCMFAGPRVVFGVGFGGGYGYVAPQPPAPLVAYAPAPYAYPGYTWIGGYWYPVGGHYYWRAGYWARPPYPRAYWVGPRYWGGRYYRGYWHR